MLLKECNNSRSRVLYPFVVLAIETGARKNVIRALRWKWVDFANRCIQFGKDKTPSSTGRVIPLNQRALAVPKMWAQQFPNRQGDHFLFFRLNDMVRLETCLSLRPTPPTPPNHRVHQRSLGSSQEAGGSPMQIPRPQTHRSLAMLDAGVPIAKVAKIVGWSPSTMVRA